MKALEYKMHANNEGNRMEPYFISKQVNGLYANPADYTMIGLSLGDDIYVPDEVTQLTRAELKTRCYQAGIMMKSVDNAPVQMSEEEIDAAINAFCDEHSID